MSLTALSVTASSLAAISGQGSAVAVAGPASGLAGSGPAASVAAGVGVGSAVSAQVGQGSNVGAVGGVRPVALSLVALSVSPVGGTLTLDLSQANTFRAVLSTDVVSIALIGFPAAGMSERVTVYLAQDGVGGHAVSGWPSAVKWAGGFPPALGASPNALECLVLDVLDGGQTILGNLVGLAYA